MLKKRVESLETGYIDRDNILIIIGCYIGPSGWIEPTQGYQVGDKQLFRRHEETDEEFEDRACVAFRSRAPNAARVLVLTPIEQEEICGT